MLEESREAWRTDQRINRYLIDAISEEGMRCVRDRPAAPHPVSP